MGQLKRQLVIWGAIAATTAALPGLALAEGASPDFGGHHGGDHHGDRHGKSTLAVAGRAMGGAEQDVYGIQIRGRSGDKPTDAGGMVRFGHRGEKEYDGLVGQITCLSQDKAGIVTVTGTIKRSGTKNRGDMGRKDGLSPAEAGGLHQPSVTEDDGTALLDAIVPWTADDNAEAADNPAPPALPGAPAAPGTPGKDPNKGHGPDKRHDGDQKGSGELAGKDFAFTIDVPGKPQHFSQPTIGDKGTLAACSGGGAPVEVKRGHFRTRDAADRKDDGDHHGFFGRRHHKGGDK